MELFMTDNNAQDDDPSRVEPRNLDQTIYSRQYQSCSSNTSSMFHPSYRKYCTNFLAPSVLLLITLLTLSQSQPNDCSSAEKFSKHNGGHIRSFNEETSDTHESSSDSSESLHRPSSSSSASSSSSSSPTSYELPEPDHGGTSGGLMAGAASDEDNPTIDPSTGEALYPAPDELSVVRLNDTSIVLRWEVHESANENLQFFKIQYKSTKKSENWRTDNREIPPHSRAHQINGLRPGSYWLTVVAVYDNDDNIPSAKIKYRLRASSKLAPDELPEMKAPVITYRVAEWDNIRFKWRYIPKNKDVEDVGYLVYYRSLHIVMDFLIHTSLDESVEISEVEPDTPYEAKVVAYNRFTVSNFSETITIKTPSHPNATTITTLPASSTPASPTLYTTPNHVDKNSNLLTDQTNQLQYTTLAPSSDESPFEQRYSTTTLKPILVTPPPTFKSPTTTFYMTNQTLTSLFEFVLGDPSDTMTAIRYSLLIVLLIICITSVALCLTSCHQNRKHSPPSSTNESAQFDLEINSYFKNSFPGVEKEYSWQNDMRVM